jgi:uncharacterized protein (TIGR00106 family)
MLVAFSVAPTVADETGSVADAVAAAVKVVQESGLPWELTSMFTTIEGEWDEVMDVVKRAVEAVAAVSPRVSLVLKADIRPGFTGQLTAKVERVRRALDTAD